MVPVTTTNQTTATTNTKKNQKVNAKKNDQQRRIDHLKSKIKVSNPSTNTLYKWTKHVIEWIKDKINIFWQFISGNKAHPDEIKMYVCTKDNRIHKVLTLNKERMKLLKKKKLIDVKSDGSIKVNNPDAVIAYLQYHNEKREDGQLSKEKAIHSGNVLKILEAAKELKDEDTLKTCTQLLMSLVNTTNTEGFLAIAEKYELNYEFHHHGVYSLKGNCREMIQWKEKCKKDFVAKITNKISLDELCQLIKDANINLLSPDFKSFIKGHEKQISAVIQKDLTPKNRCIRKNIVDAYKLALVIGDKPLLQKLHTGKIANIFVDELKTKAKIPPQIADDYFTAFMSDNEKTLSKALNGLSSHFLKGQKNEVQLESAKAMFGFIAGKTNFPVTLDEIIKGRNTRINYRKLAPEAMKKLIDYSKKYLLNKSNQPTEEKPNGDYHQMLQCLSTFFPEEAMDILETLLNNKNTPLLLKGRVLEASGNIAAEIRNLKRPATLEKKLFDLMKNEFSRYYNKEKTTAEEVAYYKDVLRPLSRSYPKQTAELIIKILPNCKDKQVRFHFVFYLQNSLASLSRKKKNGDKVIVGTKIEEFLVSEFKKQTYLYQDARTPLLVDLCPDRAYSLLRGKVGNISPETPEETRRNIAENYLKYFAQIKGDKKDLVAKYLEGQILNNISSESKDRHLQLFNWISFNFNLLSTYHPEKANKVFDAFIAKTQDAGIDIDYRTDMFYRTIPAFIETEAKDHLIQYFVERLLKHQKEPEAIDFNRQLDNPFMAMIQTIKISHPREGSKLLLSFVTKLKKELGIKEKNPSVAIDKAIEMTVGKKVPDPSDSTNPIWYFLFELKQQISKPSREFAYT